jgi:hypothetical protein
MTARSRLENSDHDKNMHYDPAVRKRKAPTTATMAYTIDAYPDRSMSSNHRLHFRLNNF